MLLKDIIKRAISILGLENEVNVDTPCQKLEKLVDSANLMYSELSLQYISLKDKEKHCFIGNRVYYTQFKHNVREILLVKKDGVKTQFVMYPLYVEADFNGEAEITYLYHLKELSLNDSLLIPPQFSEYVLAVGVVSEYCFRTGLIDEAVFYKNRYDNAVINLQKRKKSISLPARRFYNV